MLSGAADEAYVRSCLIRALEGVSEVAADVNLGAYLYGMEVPCAVRLCAAAGTHCGCLRLFLCCPDRQAVDSCV
jgi:hypothetical protein